MARHSSLSRVLVLSAALALAGRASAGGNCAGDSTGLTPLTDLGLGLYQGVQGGLYAAGSNHRPPAHNAAGLAIANALTPLDTLGHPDPTHGRIVLISIGMSNTTQEFSAFVPKAAADPLRNPHVRVIDCAEGGQSADRINSATAAYWDTVLARLRGHGSAPAQVQVAWLKEADASPEGNFSNSNDTLVHNLGAVVRILEQKCPNLKLCYLTSRVYAGYATTALNPEPYAYESGFAVKHLIDAQINGVDSLNYDATRGAVVAPWMAWGPYLWTDGLKGRLDGLVWPCSLLVADGTHPSTAGRNQIADSLLAFFRKDEIAMPWYLAPTISVPALSPARAALAIAPNPARGTVDLRFSAAAGEPWEIEVLDPAGRRVRRVAHGIGSGGIESRRWDGRDESGGRPRAGVYIVRLRLGSSSETRRFTLLDPR